MQRARASGQVDSQVNALTVKYFSREQGEAMLAEDSVRTDGRLGFYSPRQTTPVCHRSDRRSLVKVQFHFIGAVRTTFAWQWHDYSERPQNAKITVHETFFLLGNVCF